MKRLFLFFISFLFLTGCGEGSKHYVTVGVDPNWYPLNFGLQNSYVNGYTEELFLEISSRSDLRFQKMTANWDTLLDGLKNGRYEAILSSLPPYAFNLAEYDFSEPFLETGLVLIVPTNSPHTKLKDMRSIGTLGSPSIELLELGNLTIQQFDSIPHLFEATVSGAIDGAVIDRLPASNYVSDLFAGKLKVLFPPITNAGLRLITLKGKKDSLLREFNQNLKALKKKRLRTLQEKWQVG